MSHISVYFNITIRTHFSEEARAWAAFNFPNDVNKEKYYDLSVELEIVDDQEVIRAMDKPRWWQVEIRNIEFTNHMGLGDYFFVFKIGYNVQIVKKFAKPKSAPREIDAKVISLSHCVSGVHVRP